MNEFGQMMAHSILLSLNFNSWEGGCKTYSWTRDGNMTLVTVVGQPLKVLLQGIKFSLKKVIYSSPLDIVIYFIFLMSLPCLYIGQREKLDLSFKVQRISKGSKSPSFMASLSKYQPEIFTIGEKHEIPR